jgi:hypothetical protein
VNNPMNPNLSRQDAKRLYGSGTADRDATSRPFLLAFGAGVSKIALMLASLLVLVQLLYAIGWAFVLMLPQMRANFRTMPETAWAFASDANLAMLSAGVAALLCVLAVAIVVVGVALLGGWKPQLEDEQPRHDVLPPSMRES